MNVTDATFAALVCCMAYLFMWLVNSLKNETGRSGLLNLPNFVSLTYYIEPVAMQPTFVLLLYTCFLLQFPCQSQYSESQLVNYYIQLTM